MKKQELYQKYKYIVAYHKATGSFDYYIWGMVSEAQEDNAPADAYVKINGKWYTYDEAPDNVKKVIDKHL